jgi:hypothetical protein
MLSILRHSSFVFRAAALGLALGNAVLIGPAAAGSLIGNFPAFIWPTDQSTCTTCTPDAETDGATSR